MPTTIKATLENAQQLREVIAGWPELAQTIDGLRQQGMFPGLRCLEFKVQDGVTLESLCSSAKRPGVKLGAVDKVNNEQKTGGVSG